MSTKQVSFDLYQAVTDRIIALLEAGTIPWQRPWRGGPPMNAITNRPYHGINHWLLLSLKYESNRYLTFNQVVKAGGTVKRGEHGHIVVYWQVKLREPKFEEEGVVPRTMLLLRYYKVFNVEQCEGLATSLTELEKGEDVNPILACENIVAGMPLAPEIRFGGHQAYYHIDYDHVNMPEMRRFRNAEGYYNVLFHELIHSTGHRKRLNRPTVSEMSEFGSDKYSNEELIAELGSCYLAAYAGIETQIKNSAAYIESWLSRLRGDRKIMLHVSSYAHKAVDYILGNIAEQPEVEAISAPTKPDIVQAFCYPASKGARGFPRQVAFRPGEMQSCKALICPLWVSLKTQLSNSLLNV